MTTIEKPLQRETAATYRGRPLIVRLHPRFIEVGLKRHRLFKASYDALYEMAMKLEFRAQAAQNERSVR